jgi:hypothetical protein
LLVGLTAIIAIVAVMLPPAYADPDGAERH